ncbi:MAG: hypothetical protein I8N66_19920 [Ensifer sp. SSB1]|nr:hypothetical protein [Ensifer sp. SSB1]
MSNPTPSTFTPPAARGCGTCTLCCRLPDIDALAKPANAWCRHCVDGEGCRIYAQRPQLCRDFLCLWRTDADLDDAWDPARSRMMIYRQGPQVTVLVDPDHSEIWKQPPYAETLQRWAHEGEGGQYVIVFVGDAVFKID